jgi:hypothetical protein
LKKFKFFLFFSLLQINIFLVFLDYFDALISKMIFKKIKKNIILIYFLKKNTLKNNRNHTPKQAV